MTVRPSEAGREAPERDPDLIHLVSARQYAETGSMVARCGFDCAGRTPKPFTAASCVVCLDLARAAR